MRKDNGYVPRETSHVRVITDAQEAALARTDAAADFADRLYHYTHGRQGECHCHG
jgi:hypothetical protein